VTPGKSASVRLILALQYSMSRISIVRRVLCQDGLVIGADSSTTFPDGQKQIIEQPTEKYESSPIV